jgi:hypothetical protein
MQLLETIGLALRGDGLEVRSAVTALSTLIGAVMLCTPANACAQSASRRHPSFHVRQATLKATENANYEVDAKPYVFGALATLTYH